MNARRTSIAWQYFTSLPSKKAKCNMCGIILSLSCKGGGPFTLTRHIKRKHLEHYERTIAAHRVIQHPADRYDAISNESQLQLLDVRIRKNSKTRQYFTALSHDQAKCNSCDKILSCKGGYLYNLKRHIRILHSDISGNLNTPSAPAEDKGSEVTLGPDLTPETAATSDRATSSTPPPAFVAALALPPSPQPPKDYVPPPVKKFKSIHRRRYQTAHDSPPPPQQNQQVQQDENVHICSSCPCRAAQESEYDKIGKAWASELQKMSPGQQIYAKRAIAEIIFEGQLGALHRDSVIIHHIDQRVADELSPISFVEKEEPDFDC